MTGLLICASIALVGWLTGLLAHERRSTTAAITQAFVSLALIAVALWLAYAAGAQP